MICLIAESCRDNSNKDDETLTDDISATPGAPTFFGDSTLTIISSNKPNGYSVKFFQTKDLTLVNLSRGDSINQYIALHKIPMSMYMASISDLTYGDKPRTIGTYIREINIPIEEYLLGVGLFFMDVNFDGEEELVIEHIGYNRTYYACFDIVHGIATTAPGFLQPMNNEPYNNIVDGYDNYTVFDSDNKTIHIFEQMGCCSHVETWCEMVKDWDYEKPKIQIVKRKEVDYTADDYMITTISKRVDGELQQNSMTCEKL